MHIQHSRPHADGTSKKPRPRRPPATHTGELVALAAIAFAVVYLLAQLLRTYPAVVGAAVVLGVIGFGAWGMSVHRAAPRDRDGAGR
ncbi:hypothetical protein HWD35_20700 [Tsukamurella tyrosinosolvens]|uniref:hypothetical protein n=1 Tax=Tsukamurella tyrosinosolvens TaxID=57704 RepID=UPI001CE0361D|nr:hypothetical protein [Tsukamurella tyrosinosolvens]MCA4997145.1 hypothetical protein [Tsukamurella tyrosinosolvens]